MDYFDLVNGYVCFPLGRAYCYLVVVVFFLHNRRGGGMSKSMVFSKGLYERPNIATKTESYTSNFTIFKL